MALHWHSTIDEFKHAQVDDILAYLDTVPPRPRCFELHRVSQFLVLKKRMNLNQSESEYRNLELVLHLCDPAILRVPQPVRWFSHRDSESGVDGYLLMEYLPGSTAEQLILARNDPEFTSTLVDKIADAVCHLHTRSSGLTCRPGVPFGDSTYGFPWGDYGIQHVFTSVQDFGTCLNRRLRGYWGTKPKKANFTSTRLTSYVTTIWRFETFS